MKRSEPESVGQIIARCIAESGCSEAFDKAKVCFLWPEVVGAAVNRYTVRRWVEGPALHVVISSASLKNELMFMRSSIVDKLNAAAGRHIIDSLILH